METSIMTISRDLFSWGFCRPTVTPKSGCVAQMGGMASLRSAGCKRDLGRYFHVVEKVDYQSERGPFTAVGDAVQQPLCGEVSL